MKHPKCNKKLLISYICFGILFSFVIISQGVSQAEINSEQVSWPATSWLISQPKDVGMNAKALKKAEKIYPQLFPSGYSLLVIRKGKIVSESYFHKQSAETSNHIYSITKTVVATLVAIAIKQGWIESMNEKVADLLPGYTINYRNADLTIEDVMTHRSGLSFKSKFMDILNQSPKSPPGTAFEYSNQAPSLLTAVLNNKIKQGVDKDISDVFSFAKKYLFDPLGMHVKRWDEGPDKIPDGANGIYMTTRDMARIGYLLLKNGQWSNQQLLPLKWVEMATKLRVDVDRQKGYGYLIWVRREPELVKMEGGEQIVHGYFAYGHRGQFIGIYPELDLLVVTTADAADSSRDTYFVPDLLHDFVHQFIFPSFCESSGNSQKE